MRPIRHLRSVLLASTFAAITPAYAQDMPSGGVVGAGSATIASAGRTTTIRQTSDRAVIDWQRFSIGAGGTVAIDQPQTTSALLNRVKSAEMSRIAGNLTANGQVFLINPNGIVIDSTGTVQARGGFVASTLDIDNDDFMAGRLDFRGSGTGVVANRGYISGGAVALLGSQVANDGVIVARLGRVAIGAAKRATLDLNGDGLLQVAIPSDMEGGALITNTGLIDAAGGTVVLKVATAREIVRQTINMAGIIRATSVSQAGGTVLLDGGDGAVGIAGTIDVSGQSGGRIDITGGDVALTGATLTAAGGERGGLIRVGGAFQGGVASPATDAALAATFTTRFGPLETLAAARTTTIDAASTLDASGGAVGGAVVAWSTQRTRQQGIVTATGAIGGAVELSSKGSLATDLARVTPGRGGTLLLDPKNIFVYDAFLFGSGTTADPITGSVGYADAAGADATFSVADIKTLMDGGTDVFLRASNDIGWSADLTVGFAADPGDLFLSAGRSVALAGFLTLNQANLTVVANDTLANGVIDADRDVGAAEISAFNARISGAIDSGGTGGNVSLTLGSGAGVTNGLAGDMRLASITARSIAIDAGARTVALFDFGGGIDPASLRAAESLTLSGAIKVQASGGLTLSGRTVDWLNETSAALTATSPSTPIRFVENGVLTRYGVLDGGESGGGADTTRLALGKGADYGAIYGDAYGAFDALHIVSGTLQGSDTLASILAAGATTTTGPAAGQGVGDYSVTTGATAQFGLAADVSGYFVDLRTVTDTLRVTPKTLIPTVSAGAYSYGAPASVAALSGLVGSDSVGLAATVTGLGTQALSGNAGNYAFAANLAAGQRSFTLTGLTGAAAANYTLDLSGTIGAALAIAPKALTYAGTTATSTYGTLNAAAFTLSGTLFGDDVSVGVGGVTRNGVTVALTATTGVGTYATVASALTGSAAGNYAIDTANSSAGSAIIDPKTLTYSAASVATTYGTRATVATPTLSGVIAGDDVTAIRLLGGQALTLTDRTAAGSYAITPGLAGAALGNYTLATAGNTGGTLTIAPLALGYTVASITQTYGTPAAIATLSGVLTGDEVYAAGSLFNYNGGAVAVGASGIGYNPDVGSHAFNLTGISGAQSANYRVDLFAAPTTATLNVLPRAVTYSIASFDKTYGNSAATPAITFNNVVNASLDASIVTTGPGGGAVALNDISNGVGLYSLTLAPGSLSGFGSQNHVLATTGNTPGVMTIRPRTLGYTGSLATSIYGSLASVGSVSFSNLVNGDSLGAVTTILSGATPITLGERTPAGVYTVAVTGITGSAAANYALGSGIGGQLTIAPRTLGYTLGSETSVYGTMAILPFTLNGVLAGDDVAPLVLAAGTPVSDRTAAGTYVTRADTLIGAAAGNYLLSGTRSFGSLTVSPKPITYAVGASTSVYGNPYDFTGVVTFDGVLLGDQGPVATAQFVGGTEQVQTFDDYRNVGRYEVEALIAGNPNYVASAVGNSLGTYTITPRPITLDTDRAALAYGSRPDQIGTGVFLNNVLDRTKVFASLTLPSLPVSTGGYVNVGSYVASVDALQGEKAANYLLTGPNSLTISVLPSTTSVVQGDTVRATYGSLQSLANTGRLFLQPGDVASPTSLSLMRDGIAVTITPQTPAGVYAIVAGAITGADAANYSYTPGVVAPLEITPKPITYAMGDVSSVYGTAAAAPTVDFSGLVGDDRVAALTSGYTATASAGTYDLVVTDLTGPAAANYSLAATGNLFGRLTVAPKALTYSFTGAALEFGSTVDPNSLVTLNGVIGDDSIFTTLYARRTDAAAGSSFVIGATEALAFGNPSAFDLVTGGTAKLSAGGYQLTFGETAQATLGRLTGADSGNYILPVVAENPVALTVLPKAITYQVTSQAVSTYGDVVPLGVTFSGTLGGTTPAYSIIQTKDGVPRAIGAVTSLPANLDVSNAYQLDLRLQGADAFNYAASGTGTTLSVFRKGVTLAYTPTTAVYGSRVENLITIPGLLAGDDAAPIVDFSGKRMTLIPTGAGFGIAQLTQNVGTADFSVQGLSGTAADNYFLSNVGFLLPLTVTPKPVTYVAPGFSALYGGLTLPSCNVGCEFNTTFNGYSMGTATVSGILDVDQGFVGFDVMLTDGSRIFSYDEDTQAGTYAKTVELSGDRTRRANYVLSQAGSSAGAVFILPAPLRVTTSSGGRLYTDAAAGKFTTIGTPGQVTYLLSNTGGLTGGPLTSPLFRDAVTPVLALQTAAGLTIDPSQPIPVGDYKIVPIGLSGADAANYRLIADPGELIVVDVGIFNFGNLIDGTNSVYVAPAAVSKPVVAVPITPRPTGTLTTTEIEGETSTEFGTDGASLAASAGAGGTASTTSSSGDGRVSAQAEGEVEAKAEVSLAGVEAEVSAGGSAGVSLQIGPGFVDYGAYLKASASLGIDLFSAEPSIELDAMVRVGLTASAGVRGELGGGVDGELSSDSEAFATAWADNGLGIQNGALKLETKNFVGAGASTGVTLGASGGGVSGSASATVYSPGSLYLGASANSGYDDHTFSISFSLGLAIGIGGLELGVDLSFSTAKIEEAGILAGQAFTAVASEDFWTDMFSDGKPPPPFCGADCKEAAVIARRDAELEAATPTHAKYRALANPDGSLSLAQVAYLERYPEITTFDGGLYALRQRYAGLPAALNDIVVREQALAKKVATSAITLDDLKAAQTLRAREQDTLQKLGELRAQIVVDNGALTLVQAIAPPPAVQVEGGRK